MEPTKIAPLRPPVPTTPHPGDRLDGRVLRALLARRRLDPPRPSGRAWINGREAGGPDARYAHLGQTYD